MKASSSAVRLAKKQVGTLGRSGPNLKPRTVCVCGMNGLRKGMNTTQHPPSPASRAGTDLATNEQAGSRAGITYARLSQVPG